MARLPLCVALLLCTLASAQAEPTQTPVTPGAVVLRNSNGMQAHILPTGACVQRLLVPDRNGTLDDVIMGFDDTAQIKNGTSPSGCLVGRVGGRISNASFALDGVTYKLDGNAGGGKDTLHGGAIGFHRLDWVLQSSNKTTAVLTHFSPDGEQAFPGNLTVRVVYTLTHKNELTMNITATADKATPVSIFSHPYLNLGGFRQLNTTVNSSNAPGTVLDHELTIHGDFYMPTDAKRSNPTGEILPVNGTALDFRTPHTIGERIDQVAENKGYSNTYALFGLGPDAKDVLKGFVAAQPPQLAATLAHPGSGRALDILTTAPAMVLYTGNAFAGKWVGKGGIAYQQWQAVALETTMFPDAVNQPNFPPITLRPGQQYSQQTVWRFYVAPLPCTAPGCKKCAGSDPTGTVCVSCKSSHKLVTKNDKLICVPKKCSELIAGCRVCKPGSPPACQQCDSKHVLRSGKCKPKTSLRLAVL